MNKLLILLILLLVNSNCYLSDLEGYKHLEKHDYDYMYIDPLSQPFPFAFIDSSLNYRFSIHSDFSIKRTLSIRFYTQDDTTTPSNFIYLTGPQKMEMSRGQGNFTYNFSCSPSLCSQYFKIKAYAISDVDTVVSSIDINKQIHFHCEKGGVDSISFKLTFGNDSNQLSFIAPLQYFNSNLLDYTSNPIILTRFSKNYSKPFIMLFTSDTFFDPKFDFIQPRNFDSIVKLNPMQNCYFFESESRSSINREVLCDIWMKQGFSRYTRTVQELSKYKQYMLVYPIEKYSNYYYQLFLLRINTISYSSEFSGNAECTLFTLN